MPPNINASEAAAIARLPLEEDGRAVSLRSADECRRIINEAIKAGLIRKPEARDKISATRKAHGIRREARVPFHGDRFLCWLCGKMICVDEMTPAPRIRRSVYRRRIFWQCAGCEAWHEFGKERVFK